MAEEKVEFVKAVCQQKCYVADGLGELRIRYPGDIVEFKKDKVSEHFIEMEKHKVDFRLATESELMGTPWTFAEAKEAMQEFYGVELVRHEGMGKDAIVRKILDIRYRDRG